VTRAARLPIGDVIDGRYRVLGVLGEGGMATVYLVEQIWTGQPLALKLPSRVEDPRASWRLLQEGRALARLHGPNVLRLYDVTHTPSLCFLVTERLVGTNLRSELEASGVLSPERAVAVLDPVCAALEEAHAAGVVHRDVKPDHIALARTPRGESVRLLDFGVSQLDGGDPEAQGPGELRFGTPWYVAPEQVLHGVVDGRADIYAVGVVAYEALSGRVPYDAPEDAEIVRMHLDAPVPDVRERRRAADTPELLARVIRRAMAKDPEERFESVRELRRALWMALGAG
jgi:serine/threonine-protein kinase